MLKARVLIFLMATMTIALLSGCGNGGGAHISGTYSSLNKYTTVRFGDGTVQFGSLFGGLIRSKGGSDTGTYTVKGNMVTATIETPSGKQSMMFQIKKDGCLYSKDLKTELCKQ